MCVCVCDNHIISFFAAARVINKHLKASVESMFPPTDVSQVKSLLIPLIPVTTEFVITLLSPSYAKKNVPYEPRHQERGSSTSIIFILALPQTTAAKDMHAESVL